ncbi:MAG: TonB-dependent siderophore receptor [Pseudomonadota bacterium]
MSLRGALLSSVVIVAGLPATAQDQESFSLDTILVEGSEGVVTEDTGSFATNRATVGGRQPVDVRDVPQSITVITDARIKDAEARSLEEASYLIPNLSVALGDPFTGSLYSRGYEVFTYNIDGAPRPFLSIYGTAPDLVFFDRVELLSGPSGVYQGTGEPVGTINLVRKRPTDTAQGNAYLSFGSFDNQRGEFDYSTPLNAAGTVRARVIGYAEHQGSFVDVVENDQSGLSATVDIDVNDALTLSFGVIAESQDAKRFSGLPTLTDGTLLDVPRETFIGADWNDFESDSTDIFAEAQYQTANGGVFQLTTRRYARDVSIQSFLGNSGVDPVTGAFETLTFAREYEEVAEFVDVNYTSPFAVYGVGGEFTIGADYRRTQQDTLQNFDFSAGPQTIDDFDPGAIPEPDITFPGVGPGFRLNTDVDSRERGLYGQARIDLGARATLSTGLRYVMYDSKSVDTGRDLVRSDIDEKRFVTNLGVTYDFNDSWTAYAGYSDIFQPQADQRADGAQLNPIIGQQLEIGAKGVLADGRLVTQASLFWIRDDNRAIDDPDNPGASLDGGRARTKGLEVLVNGEIAPNWSISGGYVYVDTDREDDPTSPHNFSLWGRYTVPDGWLAGMDLGLGIRAASSFEAQSGDVTIKAPGYAVYDAMVRYPITDAVSAQLSVQNIFDKTYYTRVNEVARGNFYGEPRSFTFSLAAQF